MLAGLAARTDRIALGLLVGGVTYRNPSHHAKAITTVDVISGGRAFHGIGAAWFEAEHNAYGFRFPPLKERFERLEDHLRIVRAMFTQDQATVEGKHHSVTDAYNNPKPLRGDIPILIGGSGERKTLRLVAQYADGCNLLFGDLDQVRHLLGVLERHCDDVGRDPAEITKTVNLLVAVAETEGGVQRQLDTMRELDYPADRITATTAGTPDHLLEIAHAYRDAGVDGLTFSLADASDLESVALAGRTLAPLFGH
jgi:alkanesulfonate monooxygenase SsuD/methylene tetrahydromethanopterin reductase-like flavin-dependent oxidoreductase (luciferase family)